MKSPAFTILFASIFLAGGGIAFCQTPPQTADGLIAAARVADNFYFLGTKIHISWALVGNQGIVIIETFCGAAPG